MIDIPAAVIVAPTTSPALPGPFLICAVPPGACTVTLSNTGANTVYIGTTNTVTVSAAGSPQNAGAGFPLPTGATVTVSGHPGSTGATLWGNCVVNSATTVGVIISTPS
jgi:hypothetical protein